MISQLHLLIVFHAGHPAITGETSQVPLLTPDVAGLFAPLGRWSGMEGVDEADSCSMGF